MFRYKQLFLLVKYSVYIFRTNIIIDTSCFLGVAVSSNTQSRDEKIDFRVTRESPKSLFTRAAELSGVSLTSFVIEAARERAMRLNK